MKMMKILADRMARKHPAMYTIPYNTTVQDAARYMCERDIGAVLVEMEHPVPGQYAGILSERDILKCCAQKGNFDTVKVNAIMTQKLVIAHTDDEARLVVKKMRINHIRHIPLSDDEKIIALISIRDLMHCVDRENEVIMSHMSDLCGNIHYNKNY